MFKIPGSRVREGSSRRIRQLYIMSDTSNLYANATNLVLGNSSVNLTSNSTLLRFANATTSANLGLVAGLVIGTSTVNASTLVAGNFTANTLLANAVALNVVNQTNTATLFVTTSANVGTAFTANSTVANAIALNVVNQTNTATLFVTTSANVGTQFVANSSGVTVIGFVNATTVVNSASHTIGATMIANTLGVYHTGIMNAASHTTTGVTANVTGVYPTSNSSGQALGLTAQRWILFANSADIGPNFIANSLGVTQTGFVNATVVVNSASHTIGTTFIANTLGVYHTGTMNAASHTTTGFLANATHVVPTSNTSGQNLGNTISRWVITANTVDVGGNTINSTTWSGTSLTANNATNLGGAAAAAYLRDDVIQQGITGGSIITSNNQGTKNTGTYTYDVGVGPMQHISANGAFILSPGANTGHSLLDITNGTAAGAITLTGWTKTAGDAFTTTSTNKFRCHITIGNAGSLIVVQAFQ
jgi:hypothetical protein